LKEKLVNDEYKSYNDEENTKEIFASFVILKRMDDFKRVSKTLLPSMNEFKDVVTSYAIDNEKYMKFTRNDNIRSCVVRKGGLPMQCLLCQTSRSRYMSTEKAGWYTFM
jgi:hypothetical protein